MLHNIRKMPCFSGYLSLWERIKEDLFWENENGEGSETTRRDIF